MIITERLQRQLRRMQYVQLSKQDQADVAEEVLAEFDRCETIIRSQMTALVDAGMIEEAP